MVHSGEMSRKSASRRSGSDLLLLLVGLASTGLGWYCMVQPFLKLRLQFFPRDAFLMDKTRLGNIAMHVAPEFPAGVVGFLFADHCISTFWPAVRVGTRKIERGAGSTRLIRPCPKWRS